MNTNKGLIYNNKLNFKVNKLDKNTKNTLKNAINDIAVNTYKFYGKNTNVKKVILNSNDKNNIITNIKYAMQLDDETANNISSTMIKQAVISSLHNQMIASGTKYEKVDGFSISLTKFFISIQSQLNKKIVLDDKQREHLQQQAIKKANKKPIKIRK